MQIENAQRIRKMVKDERQEKRGGGLGSAMVMAHH